MSTSDLDLPELQQGAVPGTDVGHANASPVSDEHDEHESEKLAADLQPVFDVPVSVQAVIGKTKMEVSELLQLGPGSVLELDRRVGEAIDIYVNSRLVARGEVVVIEDQLGVTMTEIIKNSE